jgi:hypothetical protein
VNLLVAVSTLHFIDKMGAGIVLCRFFFMATMAGDRLCMDSGPFSLNMVFNLCDIPVATVAGVCPMNRLGKLPLADLLSMTAQTF